MSDQHQAAGEPSGRPAESAAAPDTEAVTAGPPGEAKPRTGSAPEAAAESAASAPEAGAEESGRSTGSTRSTGSPSTEAGAGGASAPGGSAGTAESGTDESASSEESAASAGAADSAAGVRSGRVARSWNARRGLAATTGTTATAGAGGDEAGSGAGAPGRPGKPVLAGAAMVGVILVAVPLLVMATSKGEEKKAVNTGAAENILKDEDDPAGAFVAESPAPSSPKPKPKTTPTPTPGTKAETKNAKGKAGPEQPVPAAPAPTVPRTKTGQPAKAEQGVKAQRKKASGSLPSVLTRVLIKNNTNGTCVDIPGYSSGRPDTEVHHFTCNNTNNDNQLWNVEQRYASAGPGGVPLFQIRNVMDGMCLDLPGNGGVGGATGVTEYPCDGTTGDNQLWWLDKRADGKFWIRNAASNNQCLDSYSRSEKERQLIIWPCAPENQNNHEWSFTRS
ncbi:RICIN domain-containing protein [Streptomyces qinzhouensis]|uniref:Ricin-type beta-trefoil lectin domain protein n=1 Tax=Streptomyces qinzhouensis TaxID=2599401 RepID=A0A5B8JRB8_9ACTN|nr:RICIN domain-containing protein [Streptomyces qinzhouensis]QDY80313.1 ricin-type beta-trefoil lectin domain protein [Streptomyces qinzhouensis]